MTTDDDGHLHLAHATGAELELDGGRDSGLEVDERLDVEDLAADPRLDSEALCLCGLLWSNATVARTVVDLLQAKDFTRPAHRDLLAVIATELRHGRPHDPASIAAVFTRQGTGHLVAKALADATAAGATPESTGHHAVHVVSAAYRRSFHTAAAGLAQAAEHLPEHELFPHLVTIGRAQRAATERLHRISTTLDTSHTLRAPQETTVPICAPCLHMARDDVRSASGTSTGAG